MTHLSDATYQEAVAALRDGREVERSAWGRRSYLSRSYTFPNIVVLMEYSRPGLSKMTRQADIDSLPSILDEADRLATDWRTK